MDVLLEAAGFLQALSDSPVVLKREPASLPPANPVASSSSLYLDDSNLRYAISPNQRYADPPATPEAPNKRLPCSFIGCSGSAGLSGLCKMHCMVCSVASCTGEVKRR